MICSMQEQHFEDPGNLFKALIKFKWKISPQKCLLFRDHLTNMGLLIMLKDDKPSCIPVRRNCDAIINLQPVKSVNDCRTFCGIVSFL